MTRGPAKRDKPRDFLRLKNVSPDSFFVAAEWINPGRKEESGERLAVGPSSANGEETRMDIRKSW